MTSDFYVHIIESPSPEELLDGMTEGSALCSFLNIARIPYSYNLAVNPEQFEIGMTQRVDDPLSEFGLPPILHLSMHGGESGIQLTTQREFKEVIPWNQLAQYIRPIHQIIGGIGVCMSCCEGANGTKMAEVIRSQDVPFSWLIGTSTTIDVRDAALAFAVFYRRLHCGSTIQDLLTAMQTSSGIPDFNIWLGNLKQQEYSQAVAEHVQRLTERYQKKSKWYGPKQGSKWT